MFYDRGHEFPDKVPVHMSRCTVHYACSIACCYIATRIAHLRIYLLGIANVWYVLDNQIMADFPTLALRSHSHPMGPDLGFLLCRLFLVLMKEDEARMDDPRPPLCLGISWPVPHF